MADGGNVELVEVDGLNVLLRLQGACGSCPSSLTTMTMGIKRRLMERIPVRIRTHPPLPHPTHLPPSSQEILDVEQIMDEATGLELTAENVDTVMSL